MTMSRSLHRLLLYKNSLQINSGRQSNNTRISGFLHNFEYKFPDVFKIFFRTFCRLIFSEWPTQVTTIQSLHDISNQWCRGASAPQMLWFGENPGKISGNLQKIPENLGKLHKNTSKNGAQRAVIWKIGAENHMKIAYKVAQIFFGQFWRNQAKIFRTPKNLPASTPMLVINLERNNMKMHVKRLSLKNDFIFPSLQTKTLFSRLYQAGKWPNFFSILRGNPAI